ncbi:MAG TPA: glycosyltransferase family 2 protein [Promicromonospora sp.]|nr:glycosyltransferase family 2 protein [Promicromonospora sp.]
MPDDPRTPPAADVVPAGTGGPLPTAVTPVPDTVYLLPLRRAAVDPAELAELASYLRRLARHLPVVVADASPPEVRQWHAAAWGARVRSIAVPDVPAGTNGKVIGVRTALAATTEPRVVVADDDVRYPVGTLRRVVAVLDHADLVEPQNAFAPAPWHARWDTARTLVNRAFCHDYAGTVAFRRTALGDDAYDAGVLFENLELERTVLARGGRVEHVPDLVVPRRPPSARRFAEQRVRQAYDSFAQPPRLLAELALAPLLVAAAVAAATHRASVRRGGRAVLGALLGGAVVVAEVGRRRAGGSTHYPPTAPLWAPAWLLERAVAAWVAVGWRLGGGVPYAGTRLRRAAHSLRDLRAREAIRAAHGTGPRAADGGRAGEVSPAGTPRTGPTS